MKRGLSISFGHLCLAGGLAALCAMGGCRSQLKTSALPVRQRLDRDSLVVYSNFRLPRKHRMIEELADLRQQLVASTGISISDEPISIYLFDDLANYRRYMLQRFPDLADRRALFVKSDTQLNVYAQWGDQLAEDLRHEVTHAYLHGSIPQIPLWLDEGLAEYCETGRDRDGRHERHVALLANEYRERRWSPNLNRLENISRATDLTQLDYAESWLWVHFLLHESQRSAEMLKQSLATVAETGSASSVVPNILENLPDAGGRVLDHLQHLAETIQQNQTRHAIP